MDPDDSAYESLMHPLYHWVRTAEPGVFGNNSASRAVSARPAAFTKG
jgi:hypothetical protein